MFQNPRTDPPTQKVALDSTTSTTRCSTAYVHPATSDDVFSLAGWMPSTHSPAQPGPDNPTRPDELLAICTRQRATTSSRCRAIYGPTRPGPPLSSALGGFLLGRLCCTSVLDIRFVRNSLFSDKSLLSCGAHDSVSQMLAT